MKKRILIVWNELWKYQLNPFLNNSYNIDILSVSKEHHPKEISQFVDHVFYYNGPKWIDQTEKDHIEIKNLFRKIFKENKYDYIFPTWYDRDIDFYSYINEKCNLIGIKKYHNIQNKKTYYDIFNQLEIPSPRNYIDVKEFPVICKPSNGSGSQGIQIFFNEIDLNIFLRSENYNSSYIIQQYIKSQTICVVGHVHEKEVFIDLIYDIEISDPPYCIETGFKFPSKFNYLNLIIKEHLQKFINYIELDNSPFMLDVLVKENEEFFFIDFSARISYSIYELMYYTNNENYFYNLANKFLNDVEFSVNNDNSYIYRHILFDKKTIKEFKYDLNEGIVEFSVPKNRLIGKIKNDFDTYDNTARVIVVGNNLDLCEKYFFEFLKSLEVEFY